MAIDLAGHQTPSAEVRSVGGDLVGRVTLAKADELAAAGIVSPITNGKGRLKYMLMLKDEPLLERAWRGGSNTTERIRNEWGTVIGAPKSGLQHKPLVSPQ